MSRKDEGSRKVSTHKKGAWTVEEDAKLSQFIELQGPKKWRTIAIKSGLNRCGKSCRLRWLNYLRPDITRGNITRDEVDLIHRLHKLLGNKWAWIAGRIPGRTDNEIKNYWNSHLSKKTKKKKLHVTTSRKDDKVPTNSKTVVLEEEYCVQCKIGLGDTCISFDANPATPEKKGAKCDIGDTSTSFDAKAVAEEECAKWDIGDTPINSFDVDEFFHFSEEGTFGLDWVKTFLELDDNDLTLSNYSKEF